MKIKKSMLSGIFLVFIMGGSTFAYILLQPSTTTQETGENEIELPEQSVIDYRLTPAQQRYLLLRGYTLVEVEYSLTCDECGDMRNLLGSAVNEFSNQMILSELVVSDSDILPVIRMESSYGRLSLSKPTQDEVMEAFCDILVQPPIRCATSGM